MARMRCRRRLLSLYTFYLSVAWLGIALLHKEGWVSPTLSDVH